jgi:hypothetical protein
MPDIWASKSLVPNGHGAPQCHLQRGVLLPVLFLRGADFNSLKDNQNCLNRGVAAARIL